MSLLATDRNAQAGSTTYRSAGSSSKSSKQAVSQQHRGNHVAALVAHRQPETMAEELLAVQQYNNELQQQLKHALTDARHKDAELKRCKQALLAAEGLLQVQQQHSTKQQLSHLPGNHSGPPNNTAGSSCLETVSSNSATVASNGKLSPRRAAAATLRNTQQACLIGVLKDQVAALKQTIDQLQQRYAALLQPDSAAQQVDFLQQQLHIALGQLQQQHQTVQQLGYRAEQAQQVAHAASAQVGLASNALQEVRAAAAAAAQSDVNGTLPAQDLLDLVDAFIKPPVPDASGLCTSKALVAAQEAHRMLLQQALLLRGRLPAAKSAFVSNPYGSSRLRGSAAGSLAAASKHVSGADADVKAADAVAATCMPTSGLARSSSPAGGRNSVSPPRGDKSTHHALELLAFLRAHVARLQATLDSLPGASNAAVTAAAAATMQQQQLQMQQCALGADSAGDCSHSSGCQQWTRPASAGMLRASVEELKCSLNGFPSLPRPVSAQVLGHATGGLGSGTVGRPASPAGSRPASAQHLQQHFPQPDLSPYVNFPPKRPASASSKARELAALQDTVQELQGLLQGQHWQMQQQQEKLQGQEADALQLQQHIVELQQLLEVSQQELLQVTEAAAGKGQQLQGTVQQLQAHNSELQQQLATSQLELAHAQQRVADAQQLRTVLKQRHKEEVQLMLDQQKHHLEQLAKEHALQMARWVEGSSALQEQLATALAHAADAEAAAQKYKAESMSSAGIAKLANSFAAALPAMAEEQLIHDANSWLDLAVAVARLLAVISEAVGEGSASQCGTEQLEEQLEESTAIVDDCMAALQEVCAMSRRASAAGPALLQLKPGEPPLLNPLVVRMSQVYAANSMIPAILESETQDGGVSSAAHTIDGCTEAAVGQSGDHVVVGDLAQADSSEIGSDSDDIVQGGILGREQATENAPCGTLMSCAGDSSSSAAKTGHDKDSNTTAVAESASGDASGSAGQYMDSDAAAVTKHTSDGACGTVTDGCSICASCSVSPTEAEASGAGIADHDEAAGCVASALQTSQTECRVADHLDTTACGVCVDITQQVDNGSAEGLIEACDCAALPAEEAGAAGSTLVPATGG